MPTSTRSITMTSTAHRLSVVRPGGRSHASVEPGLEPGRFPFVPAGPVGHALRAFALVVVARLERVLLGPPLLAGLGALTFLRLPGCPGLAGLEVGLRRADEADSLMGYRSPMHGRRPEIRKTDSHEQELTALTERIRGWLDAGIEPHAIGVAARTSHLARDTRDTRDTLTRAGISTVSLGTRARRTPCARGRFTA